MSMVRLVLLRSSLWVPMTLPLPEPDVGDEISGDGDKVSIVSVQKLMSANTTLCYICQVRE